MASIGRTLGNRESKTPALNEVRFAGEERKDKLYEPKHKQKLVRVLTVVAYVIFVSMAAILLSLYYSFIWNPTDQAARKMRITNPDCVSMPLDPMTFPPISNGNRARFIEVTRSLHLRVGEAPRCCKLLSSNIDFTRIRPIRPKFLIRVNDVTRILCDATRD
jgi:hypothetical protein